MTAIAITTHAGLPPIPPVPPPTPAAYEVTPPSSADTFTSEAGTGLSRQPSRREEGDEDSLEDLDIREILTPRELRIFTGEDDCDEESGIDAGAQKLLLNRSLSAPATSTQKANVIV